jgi:hypothetical protein
MQSIASSYVTKFTQLAASASGRHLTLQYGNTNSWGMTYNLWADKHLKLNLFPASIYSQQTAWYKTVQRMCWIEPLRLYYALTGTWTCL